MSKDRFEPCGYTVRGVLPVWSQLRVMPGTLIFSFFALVHWCIGLAALAVLDTLLLPALCLFIVEAVTAFDNGATVLGKRLGVGPAAEHLSRRRFLLHATCIGFLVPVYSGIGREVAFSPFGGIVGDAVAWILAVGIIAYGYFYQYRSLARIMPVSALGCLRYAQAVTEATRWPGYQYSEEELNARPVLPMASIITTTLGLLFALVIGVMGGFWVPFLVTALMFLAGALPQKGWGPIAISSLEVVFSSGMLYSLWYVAAVSAA